MIYNDEGVSFPLASIIEEFPLNIDTASDTVPANSTSYSHPTHPTNTYIGTLIMEEKADNTF